MGQPRNKKYDSAPDLYRAGMSVGEIAKRFTVTRQAMWKILQRRGIFFRAHLKYGQENHFFIHGEGYGLEKERARNLVTHAIKRGLLIPQPCEVCGFIGTASDGRNLVHAHHDDYSKPLEVRWLCKRHHHEEHYD